jgi:Integrase core domain
MERVLSLLATAALTTALAAALKRGQVHGQTKRLTVPRVEDIPPQSCRWDRRDGSFRRADRLVSVALWLANHRTWSTTDSMVWRYIAPERRRLRSMGIRDRPTSPRSPWQNAYAERLIGSIRRECLDHVVVFGERHLRHVLLSYMNYYNAVRTHLSLGKDAPTSRRVHRAGHILCRPVLGGLHHQYVRI